MEDPRGRNVVLTIGGAQIPVRASDPDGDLLEYSISGADAAHVHFVPTSVKSGIVISKTNYRPPIHNDQVYLYVSSPVDFELKTSYDIIMTIRDVRGFDQHRDWVYGPSVQSPVHIMVLDMVSSGLTGVQAEEWAVNNPPSFNEHKAQLQAIKASYTTSQWRALSIDAKTAIFTAGLKTLERDVPVNASVGDNVGVPLAATDPDGDPVTYVIHVESPTVLPLKPSRPLADASALDAGFFEIDGTGQLAVKKTIDRAVGGTYTLTILLSDAPAGKPHAKRWVYRKLIIEVVAGSSAAQGARGVMTGPPPSSRSTRSVAGSPATPPAPSFIKIQNTRFRITWGQSAAGSSPITGFGLQYKLSSESDSAYRDVNPLPTGIVRGYNLRNKRSQSITPGTSYSVRVRAENAHGWGPWSDGGAVTTTAPPPPPIQVAPPQPPTQVAPPQPPIQIAPPPPVTYQASAYYIKSQKRTMVMWDTVNGASYYLIAGFPGRYLATRFFDSHGVQGSSYVITAHASDGTTLATVSATAGR